MHFVNSLASTRIDYVEATHTGYVEATHTGLGVVGMAHEIAKLMLENSKTFLERGEAVETAVSLGMPLSEIEEYLDWLEMLSGQLGDDLQD